MVPCQISTHNINIIFIILMYLIIKKIKLGIHVFDFIKVFFY